MSQSLEEKLDKIAEDTAYMRGKWDATIPPLVEEIVSHRASISKMKVRQGRLTEKVGLIGLFSGAIGTGTVEWVLKHLHL